MNVLIRTSVAMVAFFPCSTAVLNKAKKIVVSMRLKKRLRIDCVMCEVRTEGEEIVEHLVYSTAQQNDLAEIQ